MAITIPNTFVAGTKIEASPMNANFAETANAVDKRGDTLTGNLGANAGITVDGVDVSTIPNTSGTFNPLFAHVVIGTADTNGIRLDLESGTLAVREGDDSAYGPLTSGLLTTSGNHVPATNDGGALGTTSLSWADVFLASGGVVNWNAGDTTLTHSAGKLTVAGSGAGALDVKGTLSPTANDGAAIGSGTVSWADLFLASGGVINFNNGDVTVTHSANTLTFAGASSGYIFNDGNVGIGGTPGSVRLDLIGSLNAIRVSDVTTDATTKQGKWLQRHYTNTEEDVMVAYTLSTSTANQILIGGGSGAQNAATSISFVTAANNTTTSGTEALRITSGGNIAIGATARLYLDGVAGTGDTYITEVAANNIRVVSGGANVVSFGVASTDATEFFGDVRLQATKKLYLDSGGDTYLEEYGANEVRLTVGGSAHSAWNTTGQFIYYNPPTTAAAANAYIAQTDYIRRSTSSIRYKHDIATLDGSDALAAVMAMRPVTYRGKTDEDQRRFVGFIAEEMAEIAPLLATYDEGGESGTPNYVTYDRVTAYLVAVVQQQQQKIAALEARIH